MNASTYPRLQQFFGGYFHADWVDEFLAPDEAILYFLRREPPEMVEGVASELTDLLMRIDEIDDHRRFLFDDLWCSYDPHFYGTTVGQWLAHVLDVLKGGLDGPEVDVRQG